MDVVGLVDLAAGRGELMQDVRDLTREIVLTGLTEALAEESRLCSLLGTSSKYCPESFQRMTYFSMFL